MGVLGYGLPTRERNRVCSKFLTGVHSGNHEVSRKDPSS